MLDEQKVAELELEEVVAAAGRAGRSVDTERNRAVELHAVNLALAWCAEQGWQDARHVADDGVPWDVEAADDRGRTSYVEAKGTTGAGERLSVTRNEVAAVEQHGDLQALVHVRHLWAELDGWLDLQRRRTCGARPVAAAAARAAG